MTEGEVAMKVINLKSELHALQCDLDAVKKLCKTCANELCLHCGAYHEEHLGACNGCRWKKVKHGDITADS